MTRAAINSWRDLDAFIEAYERGWGAGVPPRIADFLPHRQHPLYSEVLVELARVDLELRWAAAQPLALEHYLGEFPELRNEAEAFAQLAFEEFRVRRQAGQPATAEEYAAKYGICISSWIEVTPRCSGSDLTTDLSTLNAELPGFQLLGELGRGAFSRVYLARQLDLANRQVVLKVSSESFAEADKLAQLQHAHIMPIYSVHSAGSHSAVCMPYFGAATLANLIGTLGELHLPPSGKIVAETVDARLASTRHLTQSTGGSQRPQRMPDTEGQPQLQTPGGADSRVFLGSLRQMSYVEAVLTIGERLADGLSHAHERGIVHRDLKPANVLLADDGRPMLLDFNLSTDLKPQAQRTEAVIGGTLPYMAPEQMAAFEHLGPAGDARGDLYSLGVILYELLAGRLPFPVRQGELETVLAAMQSDRRQPPPALRRLNPAVTPAVAAIVGHCLAVQPTCRYQSAAALRDDLGRQLKHLPLQHVSEPSLRERFRKWTVRHPQFTAALAVCAVIGGLTLAVGTYERNRRIAELQEEVATLMAQGKLALASDEPDLAEGRFHAAWMKVQSEPALFDHQAGVAGWLDHGRRAVLARQWLQRLPPRTFDERRDEALLLGALPEVAPAAAREAMQAALSLTVAGDPGWSSEREQLMLAETDLVELEHGAATALAHLDDAGGPTTRLGHERRAALLERLSRTDDANREQQKAGLFPSSMTDSALLDGIRRIRQGDLETARRELERRLDAAPNDCLARMLTALCYMKQHKLGEARVALTACLGQRPGCPWSHLFRSKVMAAAGDERAAAADLKHALTLQPSAALRTLAGKSP